MKPYLIDVENIRGATLGKEAIELQGPMSVRPDPDAMSGGVDSSLTMTLETARALHEYLTLSLAVAARRSRRPDG